MLCNQQLDDNWAVVASHICTVGWERALKRKSKNIVVNNFKYYHGTSTLFLDSIKKTGLGGLNPNIEFKHLDLLKHLYADAEKHLKEDSEYKKIQATTIAMVNQSTVDFIDNSGHVQKLHFRHDGIYIALSCARAATYASMNKYGSEILERCITIYSLLLKNFDSNYILPTDVNVSRIDQLINCKPEAVIIEILNADDENLVKEDGKTAKEALDFLRKMIPTMTEKQKFEFLQHCNFEILKPIPVHNLKFYKLIFDGLPTLGNFTYKLVEY